MTSNITDKIKTLMQENSHGSFCSDFAGIHLSGSNSQKTSLVVLRGNLANGPLVISQVYEKIGSFGSLFSDDRLVDIFSMLPNLANIFVDCPLTLPPCVACTRSICPGVISCEELSVAYMLSINEAIKTKKIKRRRRPINPQTQRLWDLVQCLENPEEKSEPSFSANMVPLVVRARTFARRLNALDLPIALKETSVPSILIKLAPIFGLNVNTIAQEYRRFEGGMELREIIVDCMIEQGWLSEWDRSTHESYIQIIQSVENFQALIVAWLNAVNNVNGTIDRPRDFIDSEGWVYLPDSESSPLFAASSPLFEK